MVKERLERDRSSGWLEEKLMVAIGQIVAVVVVAVVVLVEGGRRR